MLRRSVVDNRDWNRIEVELGALLAPYPGTGRRQPVDPSCEEPKVSKTDVEAILKHIEEALREDEGEGSV
jgi:hypothetical protein